MVGPTQGAITTAGCAPSFTDIRRNTLGLLRPATSAHKLRRDSKEREGNMEATTENLKLLTSEFFGKHWNNLVLRTEPPSWSEQYRFNGSLPNHDKQGVYAFVKGNVITYIGVATSKGGGRYRGHGLGKRFQAYSKVVDDAHTPTDARLIDAGAMMTIGFSQDHAYLANALELFLIGRLDTEHNANRPGS